MSNCDLGAQMGRKDYFQAEFDHATRRMRNVSLLIQMDNGSRTTVN